MVMHLVINTGPRADTQSARTTRKEPQAWQSRPALPLLVAITGQHRFICATHPVAPSLPAPAGISRMTTRPRDIQWPLRLRHSVIDTPYAEHEPCVVPHGALDSFPFESGSLGASARGFSATLCCARLLAGMERGVM